MAEGFNITKLEFEYSNETQDKSQYMEMTLEFEATDEYLINWCEENSKEYQRVSIIASCEDHEKYIDSLEVFYEDDNTVRFESNPKFSEVYKKAYTYNTNPYLKKTDKKNCYKFNEYIELTPTIEGAITEIKKLAGDSRTYSNFADISVLIRLIKTFDLHWH